LYLAVLILWVCATAEPARVARRREVMLAFMVTDVRGSKEVMSEKLQSGYHEAWRESLYLLLKVC
jgi:hypothetical protein